MIIKLIKVLGLILLSSLTSVGLAEQANPSLPFNSPQQIATNQMARGFLIGAVLIEATNEYYRYYQRCPENLQALAFPELANLTDEYIYVEGHSMTLVEFLLVDQLTVNKQCQITIRFKDKGLVAEPLKGKLITVQLATRKEPTATCSFNGDTAYAPAKDCHFAAINENRLRAVDIKVADRLYTIYQSNSRVVAAFKQHRDFITRKVKNMAYPLIIKLYNYHIKNQQCPTDNKDFVDIIHKIQQEHKSYLANITLTHCQISIKLTDKEDIPTYLKGRTILVDKQPDSDRWNCTVPEIDSLFVPKHCLDD